MEPIKLTNKILQNLKPESIIYAEFSEGGAMGACGTARIFTIKKDQLIFYLVDARQDKPSELVWADCYTKLHAWAKQGLLEEADGAFGNTAWKKPEATLLRDDDSASFIYQKDGQDYTIPASVQGVYSHLVAKFATRETSLEELEEYFLQRHDDFSEEEYDFYRLYLEQCKRADSGANWFDFTIMDYLGAVAYIHHINGTKYILNSEELADCRASLQKYRLRYIQEKIGWNKLNKFFAEFVAYDGVNLFEGLSRIVDESVSKLFSKLETIVSDCTELNLISRQNIASLFVHRPVLVDFSEKARTKIHEKIQKLGPSSLRSNAMSIALYLANYILHEDVWPLNDVMPIAADVILNIPLDDFNATHADHLLWVAGEVINDAWRYLSEDEPSQQKYRDFVYNIYWPRIGSLWPIVHYDEFEFKDEVTNKMFNDILSFVVCLDDLTERNLDFNEYLKNYTPKKYYAHEMLRRKAFTLSLRDLSAREQFNRIMAFEKNIAWFYFTYPKGIEEAEILPTELFKKRNNKFDIPTRFATLEQLVITPNTMGVGEYILDYLDQHFDDVVGLFCLDESCDLEQALIDLFIAMSLGVSEENEFAPLKNIGDKLIARGAQKSTIEAALKYARKHRRTILFQRASLASLF